MPRQLCRVDETSFVEWSTVVDAPVSHVFDRETAQARFGAAAVAAAELVPDCNRAGPEECSLTVEAIGRLYQAGMPDPWGMDKAQLAVSDVCPYWTNDWDEAGATIYVWVPWRPGEAPERIDADIDLHARTTVIGPDELDRLIADNG